MDLLTFYSGPTGLPVGLSDHVGIMLVSLKYTDVTRFYTQQTCCAENQYKT